MKSLVLSVLALSLSGCAAPTLYQWGNYDGLLYQSYRNPEKSSELRLKLEAHLVTLEQSRQRVAPGLYAEVGTLYLQSGDAAMAVAFYTKERTAWPESRGLMDALIANLEKRPARPEVKS